MPRAIAADLPIPEDPLVSDPAATIRAVPPQRDPWPVPWTVSPANPDRTTSCVVVLDSGQGQVVLALHGEDDAGDVAATLSWQTHSADAALLAWTLRFETLVQQLARALELDLLPREIHGGAGCVAHLADGVELAVRMPGPGGAGFTEGTLVLPAPFAGRPGGMPATPPDASGTGSEAGAAIPGVWHDVPVVWSACLARCGVEAGVLEALVPGDALVIGSRRDWQRAPSVELVDRRGRLQACATADGAAQLTITDVPAATEPAALPGEFRAGAETSADPTGAAGTEAPDATDASRAVVPVRVEIAPVTLTLAQVATLRPGTTIALARPVDASDLRIRAGGRECARGRFLTLGDLLAVRITATRNHHGRQ